MLRLSKRPCVARHVAGGDKHAPETDRFRDFKNTILKLVCAREGKYSLALGAFPQVCEPIAL